MFKKLKELKGFSLLEAILATLILGAGLIGGMITFQNTALSTINQDLSSIATQLANEKIESIMADKEYLGYAYLDDELNYPTEHMDGEFDFFSRVVSITEVNIDDLTTEEIGSGVKKISVTVNWGNQAFQQITMSTLISENI